MEIRKIKKQTSRIAFLIDTWFPFQGGPQEYVAQLARYLVEKEGYEVDIFTRNIKGKLSASEKAFEEIPGIRVKRFGLPTGPRNVIMRLWYTVAVWARLAFFGKRYFLMHGHSPLGSLVMKAAHWFNEVSTMVTVHETQVMTRRWTLKKVLHRILYLETFYNQEISTSESFLKMTNVNDHILVIPPGIDPVPFQQAGGENKSERFDVLYEGPLEWEKGIDFLFKAAKKMIDSSAFIQSKRDFLIHIVGDGSQRRALGRFADSLGISHYVKFHGKRTEEQVLPIYKTCDLFVMPSRSDGLPYSLLKAGAAGLPILATDIGDHRKVVLENQNGHLVPPDDIEEMAYYLEYYALNPHLKQMGSMSYELVKQEFDWETCFRRYKRVYEHLSSKPRRRRQPLWKLPQVLWLRRQYKTPYSGRKALKFCLTVNVEQAPGNRLLPEETEHVSAFLERFKDFCSILEIPSTLFFESDLLPHHKEALEDLISRGHELGVKARGADWVKATQRKGLIRSLREQLDKLGLLNVHMFRIHGKPDEEELTFLHEHGFEFLPVSEDPIPGLRFSYGFPIIERVFFNLKSFLSWSDEERLGAIDRLRIYCQKNGIDPFIVFECSSWEFETQDGQDHASGENFTKLSQAISHLRSEISVDFMTLQELCQSFTVPAKS